LEYYFSVFLLACTNTLNTQTTDMLFVAPHLGGATARPTALIMIDQGLQHEWRYEEERDDTSWQILNNN